MTNPSLTSLEFFYTSQSSTSLLPKLFPTFFAKQRVFGIQYIFSSVNLIYYGRISCSYVELKLISETIGYKKSDWNNAIDGV